VYEACQTQNAGGKNDHRKRDGEEENANKGSRCERNQCAALESSLTDPNNSFNDDCQYGSFEPEQQCSDDWHLAPKRVDVTQRHNADDAGQYEQAARYETADGPMHEPADVSGELLSLGARQQHAVVQCVEKSLL
jgi:hypothetical protein